MKNYNKIIDKTYVGRRYRLNPLSQIISCVVLGMVAINPLFAADTDSSDSSNVDEAVEIAEIKVKGKAYSSKFMSKNLAAVKKTSRDISSLQINDIRDLTRYDPGISVNESGNGISSGYSIRGVDRNRVAIVVDGISQAQGINLETHLNTESFSGGKNEIEFENVKSVEINKGSDSVSVGSGALGGAVIYETKSPSDVINPNQNWGLNLKNGYSSKDKRWVHAFAVAGKSGGLSGLFQYTKRKGHEIQSHNDTSSQTMGRAYPIARYYKEFRELGFNVYRPESFPQINNPAVPTEMCLTGDTNYSCVVNTKFPAKDVYGSSRSVPNPMDYNSDSYFAKLEYEFNNEHKIGLVYENTEQTYDIEKRSHDGIFYKSDKEVMHLDKYRSSRNYIMFPRYKFVDHTHEKQRKGIFYQFNSVTSDKIVDSLKVELDREDLTIAANNITSGCNLIGTGASRSCNMWNIPLTNDLGSNLEDFQEHRTNLATLTERNDRFRITADKKLKYWEMEHNISLTTGLDKNKYALSEKYNKRYIGWRWKDGYTPLDIEPASPTSLNKANAVMYPAHESRYKAFAPIKGKHYYLAINNNLKVNQYLDFNLATRYDSYSFKSSSPKFSNNKFNKFSYSGGVAVHPTNFITLSYKASTGFNIPNSAQLYGTIAQRSEGYVPQPEDKLKPEKSFNHEIALNLHGNYGFLSLSAFRAKYDDLIVTAAQPNRPGLPLANIAAQVYRNEQVAYTEGYNITGVLDLFEASQEFIPEGFMANFAYSRVKPRKYGAVKSSESFVQRNYVLDSIQPAKYVFGLDYDDPNGVFGGGIRVSHSKAKNASEVTYSYNNLSFVGEKQAVGRLSESYTTIDLNAYVNFYKNFTLRGAIYNVTNRKYTTWESLRQTGIDGLSTNTTISASGDGYGRLTAPGRNYAITLEMAF